MAEIYLRGRIYWARGQDRYGKWWRQSTKQRDPRAAKAIAVKLEQELLFDANQARNETTLVTALETLEAHLKRFKRADATIEIVETKGRHLVRLLGAKKTCSSLQPSDTTKYATTRMEEGASPHTVFHELKVLVRALRRASKNALYTPTVEPKHLMPDELRDSYVPRERWLSEADYRLLLDEFAPDRPGRPPGQDRRDYIIIMCQTGVRLSELHGIEAQHCDFAEQLLHLQGTKTAGARRTIPLSHAAAEVLERRAALTPHGPLFPIWNKVQRDLDLACLRIEAKLNPTWKRPEGRAAAKVAEGDNARPARRSAKGLPPPKKDRPRPPVRFDPVSPNDLRRTFGSWLAQNGVPLFHAAKLMGHSSTKMLERVYAQLAPQNARAAIAMLPTSITGKPTGTPRKGKLKRVK